MLSVWLTKDGRPQSIKSGTPRRYTPTITYNPSFILYSLSLRFFFLFISVSMYIKPYRFITVHGQLSLFVDIWSWPETSSQGYTSILCINCLYYCGQKNRMK